jgi:hypothetical protein
MKGLTKLAGNALLIGGELLIDWLTGKLEKKQAPARPLPHADSARQSKAARCAGHESEPQCKR